MNQNQETTTASKSNKVGDFVRSKWSVEFPPALGCLNPKQACRGFDFVGWWFGFSVSSLWVVSQLVCGLLVSWFVVVSQLVSGWQSVGCGGSQLVSDW